MLYCSSPKHQVFGGIVCCIFYFSELLTRLPSALAILSSDHETVVTPSSAELPHRRPRTGCESSTSAPEAHAQGTRLPGSGAALSPIRCLSARGRRGLGLCVALGGMLFSTKDPILFPPSTPNLHFPCRKSTGTFPRAL